MTHKTTKTTGTTMVIAIGLLLAFCSVGHSHLNVYLNLHEMLRLIGVSAELYYVRDGQVNDYALNFAVPVPANVNEISFTWQSLAHHPLPYSINIITSEPSVLPRPTLNISRIGEIPLEPQIFAIGMKCSGTRDAEVEVTISVEIILDRQTNNITDLLFRRKKICLAGTQDDVNHAAASATAGIDVNGEMVDHDMGMGTMLDDVTHNGVDRHISSEAHNVPPAVIETSPDIGKELGRSGGVPSMGGEFNPMLKETIAPPSDYRITMIIGGILAFMLLTTIVLIAYCAKGPTKRQNHGVHLIKTSSFQRLPTISSTAHTTSIYVCPSTITPTYATLTRPFREYEHEPEEFNRRLSELTVQKCRVRLSSLVQEGTYGRVYKGTYSDSQDVLVKTVVHQASQMQISLLLQEGMMLYEASHPNILSVLGVSLEDYTPFVLYPASNSTRNLKLFLQEPAYARSVTTIQTVLMASQLAMAMEHLHNHGVIHKDVAARNCVIDDQLRVKLADSSLSRDLFPCDYNCLGDGENRPIKWMSLEAIQKKHYNEGSDVWSFGVLIWEMCTLAKLPYAEIDPYEMEHYLKDGYRLAQPYNCPDELFTIMAYCWASLPTERPSFTQLQLCLSEFHTQITRYV